MKKPKKGAGDAAHTVVKAGLAVAPVFGGSVAEIFAALFEPPISKRKDEWMQYIAESLQELENKVEGLSVEGLSQNESFVTTLLQASVAAMRHHQKEKLEALRNAVLNAALPNAPEDDVKQTFLNNVDTLTPSHLRILAFFQDPNEWGRKHGISYPDRYMSPGQVLEYAFKEFKDRRDHYESWVRELYNRGLMHRESLQGGRRGGGNKPGLASLVTNLGNEFIRFVTSPIESEREEAR